MHSNVSMPPIFVMEHSMRVSKSGRVSSVGGKKEVDGSPHRGQIEPLQKSDTNDALASGYEP
jgi:hypothetical protein